MPESVLPTIVVGASQKPERYSYMAMKMLGEYAHPVVGVHPKLASVDGITIYPDIAKAAEALGSVHTVTMYVGAARSLVLAEMIIDAKPQRVIFNPGAESPDLQAKLSQAGIEVVEACTLVMLRTDQY